MFNREMIEKALTELFYNRTYLLKILISLFQTSLDKFAKRIFALGVRELFKHVCSNLVSLIHTG